MVPIIREFACVGKGNVLNYELFVNFESPLGKKFIFAEHKAALKLKISRIFFAPKAHLVLKNGSSLLHAL